MILKRTQRIVFCGMFTLAVLLTFGPVKSALAQTPTPTPTEEELKLQEEKRLLELQRDIELAKKAIRDAQPTPPEPKATPLEGNTTLNSEVRIETSMVAYKAMSHVANSIAKEVSSRVSTAKNLLIYDPEVVRDWRFHQALFPAFKGQTEDMKNQYFDLVCKDPNVSQFFLKTYCTDRVTNLRMQTGNEATRARTALAGVEAAIGAGETLIKSFIDLAALFRTETKIEGVTVTIDQSAFVAELSRALKNQFCRPNGQCFHINVYNPAAFNPRIRESETIFLVGHLFVFKAEADRIIKIRTAGKPVLVNQLNDLVGQKSETEAELERVRALTAIINNLDAALAREQVPHFRRKLWEERAKAQVELSTLGSEADLLQTLNNQNAGIKQLKAQIKALDDAVKALTDLNERFQAFVDQFIKVDEKGSSALALFIKSEDIDSIVHSGESYWLEAKPILGGGNNRTRKNLIWFFAGARVDHSGGVIAEYTLYELTGAIISSDKIAYYNGYVEPKKIMKDRLKDPVR